MSATHAAAWPPPTRSPGSPPPDLQGIVDWFEGQADGCERFAWVVRDSIDETLDGQRTGRWAYGHLSKTEKTHLGTVIEVNLQKEFEIPEGHHIDWRVAGTDLDCKFSKDLGGWEIPMEMYLCADHAGRQGVADHPALLVWANDDTSEWGVGVWRASDQGLRWKVPRAGVPPARRYNGDNKRNLSSASHADVYWLWGGLRRDLPPNVLLGLPVAVRQAIFQNGRSGQARVDALFLAVQGVLITRGVVLTVGQQDDAPKRVRDSRERLSDRGLVILGHQDRHPAIARALQLPVAEKGEWVSARLVRLPSGDPRPSVEINGVRWAVAHQSEAVAQAPPVGSKAVVRP